MTETFVTNLLERVVSATCDQLYKHSESSLKAALKIINKRHHNVSEVKAYIKSLQEKNISDADIKMICLGRYHLLRNIKLELINESERVLLENIALFSKELDVFFKRSRESYCKVHKDLEEKDKDFVQHFEKLVGNVGPLIEKLISIRNKVIHKKVNEIKEDIFFKANRTAVQGDDEDLNLN